MIKPHQFIGLAAATAVSVLLAIGLYASTNRWSTGKIEGEAFLPDLAQAHQFGRRDRGDAGRSHIDDRSRGQLWKVRDRSGFPASARAGAQPARRACPVATDRAATSIKDKLAAARARGPRREGAPSRAASACSTRPASRSRDVVVGKSRVDAFGSGRGGIYVRRAPRRRAGSPPAIRKSRPTSPTGSTPRCSRRDPTRSQADGRASGGAATRASRRAAAPRPSRKMPRQPPKPPAAPRKRPSKFHLVSMPDGKKLKQDAKIDDIVEAFSSIDLDDVRKLEAHARRR